MAQIIAREEKLSTDAVGRRPWKATSQFKRRWLTPADKAALEPPASADELAEIDEKLETALPLELSKEAEDAA